MSPRPSSRSRSSHRALAVALVVSAGTAIAIVSACAPAPPLPTSPSTAVSAVASASVSASSTSAAPTHLSLTKLLCERRKPCHVVQQEALKIPGVSYRVRLVKIGLFPSDKSETRDPQEPDNEVVGAPDLPADPDLQCQSFELWLVSEPNGQRVEKQHLVDMCNDGYGAAGIGEDDISVEGNMFTHSRSGGSNWRWDIQRTVQLSPLMLIDEDHTNMWTMGSNVDTHHWDWTTFIGTRSWYSPPCDEHGLAARDAPAPEDPPYKYAEIPQITVDGGLEGVWRTTELSTCAASMDATATRGFLLSGKPGSAADGAMRVMSTASSYLVEIDDDTLTSSTSGWADVDHLKVWGTTVPEDYGTQCLDANVAAEFLWSIRLSDAKVFGRNKRSKPSALSIEKESTSHGLRLRIKPTTPLAGVTFSFADSDDGKSIEREIATSKIEKNLRPSLGHTLVIEPRIATCAIVDGRLTPRVKPTPSDKALLGWD